MSKKLGIATDNDSYLPILDRVESSPVNLACKRIGESYRTVPPVTLSPGRFSIVLRCGRVESVESKLLQTGQSLVYLPGFSCQQ